MKKLISLLLVLSMVVAMAAGCTNTNTNTEATTEPTTEATEPAKTPLADNMETVAGKIIEKNPVEFMGGAMPLDLTDLEGLTYNTGLKSADKVKEVVMYGPMMGSIAFSMLLVRVNDAADAQSVAQEMSDNIDTRKWICVEANEKITVGYCDVVMLIMLDNQNGMSAQSFVDAFKAVCGAELDFVI